MTFIVNSDKNNTHDSGLVNVLVICVVVLTLVIVVMNAFTIKRLHVAPSDVLAEIRTLETKLSTMKQGNDELFEVMAASGAVFVQSDNRGKITGWSKPAELLFGYTETEANGNSVDMLVPNELKAIHNSAYLNAMAGTEPIHRGVTCNAQRKNGTQVRVAIDIWAIPGDRAIAVFTPTESGS
jgi:PAS domain S-box-containing protein